MKSFMMFGHKFTIGKNGRVRRVAEIERTGAQIAQTNSLVKSVANALKAFPANGSAKNANARRRLIKAEMKGTHFIANAKEYIGTYNIHSLYTESNPKVQRVMAAFNVSFGEVQRLAKEVNPYSKRFSEAYGMPREIAQEIMA